MAALLTEEGRFPAVQKISRAEYENFVTTCRQAPAPTQTLIEMMKKYKPVS